MLKLLHERREKIKAEFDQIEEEKDENARLKDEYRKQLNGIDELTQKKINEAVEKGRQITYEIEQKAHLQAKKIVAKAEEEAHHEIQKAKAQLKQDIVRITIDATKHVLQKELDEAKQKELILDFVKQAGLK